MLLNIKATSHMHHEGMLTHAFISYDLMWIKGRFHDIFLRENFARANSTTKSVFCISILFWYWKMQKIATSAVFCKNAWIWLVSLFYFASELKRVQLTGAEQFFWLQKLKFECACPELFPLANFARRNISARVHSTTKSVFCISPSCFDFEKCRNSDVSDFL